MTERSELVASIAKTLETYREGEIARPDPAHVDRWVQQFTPASQLPLLRELDHVMRMTFLTKKVVVGFLGNLIVNTALAGTNPAAYWARANVLRIQKAGQSQREMVSLFAEALLEKCGLKLVECGATDGDFIYLDDVLFSGGRVGTDLEDWILKAAPAKATVHVILMAFHRLGKYYAEKRLAAAIGKSGKAIRIQYWRSVELENRKAHKNFSDVLWPAVIPADAAVLAYVPSVKFPLDPRTPVGLGASKLFASEAGRQVLEGELLIAGVKIRALSDNIADWYRPLGCGNFGVGFGSLIATYRNCPNNCPLALWWGDPEKTSGALHWYPLLPRKTYASAENIFGVIDDD